MTKFRTLLLLLAATAATAQAALAQGSAAKVKVQSTISPPDAKGYQEVKLDVEIEKGWHIYANPPQNPEFEPTKTVVSIVSPKVEDLSIKYPEGQLRKDKIADQVVEFRVYEGTVRITARLKHVETAPLELEVRVFACDPNNCLPKGVVKLKVP